MNPDIVRVVSSGGGREPVWRQDGRELYYRSANGDTLYAVSVTPGDEFIRVAARPLLELEGFVTSDMQANYDVHLDGRQFIFIRDRTRDVREIHVVLNWFEELKAKVGNR